MKEKYQGLVKKMLETGLVNQEVYNRLVAVQESENWEMDEWDWLIETYYDDLDDTLINSLLEAAELAICYDAESSQVPPPYVNNMVPALLQFAGLNKSDAEISLDIKKKEVSKNEYTLIIKYKDREYHQSLEDFGDYYDTDGMLTILNDILTNEGKEYILHELSTSDQAFCFFKGDRMKLNAFIESCNQK